MQKNTLNNSLESNKKSLLLVKKYSRNKYIYLMIAPTVILFSIFVAYPLLWTLGYSVYSYDGIGNAKFVGLKNFIRVFNDPNWWQAVSNTFIFSSKLIIELPLALILAVTLNQKMKGTTFFRGAFFLPTVTSMAVMSIIFFFILRPYNGILNGILMNLRLTKEPIDFLAHKNTARLSVIFVSIWHSFGTNMVLFLAGLQNIPVEMYENAKIDGANERQQFFWITLPMLGNMLRVVLMLAILWTLKSFDLIWVFTEGGPYGQTDVMFTYIYAYFFGDFSSSAQFGYGAAVAIVASMILGIITVLHLKFSNKLGNNT